MVKGKKSAPGRASFLATAVTKTEVPPTLTITAPEAWRAISPVSRVTVSCPNWNVLLMGVTLFLLRLFG